MVARSRPLGSPLAGWPRLAESCRDGPVAAGLEAMARDRKAWETLETLDRLAADKALFEAVKPWLPCWLGGDDARWRRQLEMARHGDNVVYAATKGALAPLLRGSRAIANAGFRSQVGDMVEAIEAGLDHLDKNMPLLQEGRDPASLLPGLMSLEGCVRVPRRLLEAAGVG